MDPGILYSKLELDESKLTRVVGKARELIRRVRLKHPGSWKQGDQCRNCGCLELACKLHRVAAPRDKLVRLSGVKAKQYMQCLTGLQALLDLNNILTFEELAVQFGCLQMVQDSRKLLSTFKDNFLQSVPEATRPFTKLDAPVYTGAAFYLTCRQLKTSIDRKQIKLLCNVTEKRFSQVCNAFYEHCPAVLQRPKKRRKQTNTKEDTADSREEKDDGQREADELQTNSGTTKPTAAGKDQPKKGPKTDADLKELDALFQP